MGAVQASPGNHPVSAPWEKLNLSDGSDYPESHCAFLPADFPTLGRPDEATFRVGFPGTLN